MKRKFSKDFKAKVAVEALKGNQTIRELSIKYQVHPNMISSWKKRLLERIPEIFSEGQKKRFRGSGSQGPAVISGSW